MSFTHIRDQHVPIRFLRNMLERGRIPNGLLFMGPAGVGKRLTAIEFAKAVNCKNGDYDACDSCLACRKIAHGNFPDLINVAPIKKSRIIEVDTITSINEMASLRPFESNWRIFIIHDAERMRGPAQNHFLKTLEEPAGNSVFILVTEYPNLLLPTIRSRCQRVRFGALRPETVADILVAQRDLPPDHAAALAAVAQGQVSRALDFVDSDKRDAVLDVVQRLAAGEDPLAMAEEFGKYLANARAAVDAAVKASAAESGAEDAGALTPEERERIKDEQQAVVDEKCRRDLMDYLFLFEMWYRDRLVLETTADESRVFNRDQIAGLRAKEGSDLLKKIETINRSRVFLERFLNEERVFRDLFFVLAD
jgi:DNA polymerase III delta' subunit